MPDAETPAALNRRELLAGAAGLALLSKLTACGDPPQPGDGRPNVLFVFGDAHRAASMGCYGNTVVRTPHFDAFARQGVLLDCAMSNTPLCSPFRAALMSGRFGHHNGMVANVSPHNFGVTPDPAWKPGQWLPPGPPTLGGAFAAAGYRCGYVGKWHLGNPNVARGPLRLGFDDSWAAATTFTHDYYKWNYYTDRDELVSGGGYFRPHMEAELALRFIRQRDSRPWLCMLSWGPPHEPLEPPAEFRNYGDLQVPPDMPHEVVGRALPKLGLYYGLIEAIDQEFGWLMQQLDAAGMSRNTLVIYTSDHGTLMGSHGLMGKELPYSASTRVPFLWRWPAVLPAGQRVAMPFGTPDILPTLAGLCGLPAVAGVDGLDCSDVLLGRTGARQQEFVLLSAPDCDPVPYPGWRGLRSAHLLYARREQEPWLLYDLAEDPWEQHDLLAARPVLAAELDGELSALMELHGDRWRRT